MEDVESNLQHLSLLSSKVSSLTEKMLSAESAFFHSLRRRYSSGECSEIELVEYYNQYRQMAPMSGFSKRWSEGVGLNANYLMNKARESVVCKPNGPNGSWFGDSPHLERDSPRPPKGTSVVYILYDDKNRPCYVGSTKDFKARLSAHRRDKVFSYWTASPCADREEAYERETRLLRQFKPYLNKHIRR